MTTFSFRKTVHKCIVCVTQSNWVKMWFSRFPELPGNAEAKVNWSGLVKRFLIAYLIGNICAKKYQNPFMCVKVIASQRWDVFETRCIICCCCCNGFGGAASDFKLCLGFRSSMLQLAHKPERFCTSLASETPQCTCKTHPNFQNLRATNPHPLNRTNVGQCQRDGRPVEYRWRPLFNAAKFGWRPILDAVQ